MTVHLLDVNVLVALLWPAHDDHQKAQKWFGRNANAGWATCPLTQGALVRILSNPAFSRDAVSPHEALKLLAMNLKHPAHHFWADDITLNDAIQLLGTRLVGHQQITDAYLLGLALHRKGKLVTMDKGAKLRLDRHDAVLLI
jgi:toxin-antitoxin system PIN domain toxin